MNSNRRYSECGSRPRSASVSSRNSRRAYRRIPCFPPRRSKIRRARDCARSVRPSRAANSDPDPHPRAPGALALSLKRARDLEWDKEREKRGSAGGERVTQRLSWTGRDLERQGEGKTQLADSGVCVRSLTTISSIPEVPQRQHQKFLNGNT